MSDKYPRTYHLPSSPGASDDDKILDSVEHLLCKTIAITEKVDGGNCALTQEGVFARTHGSIAKHPAFDPIKTIWSTIRYDIPESYSIFGEAVYAKHSIAYNALPGFFLAFGIRDDAENLWLPWKDVKEVAGVLGLPTVPELWVGTIYKADDLSNKVDELIAGGSRCGGEAIEGLVIRTYDRFTDFSKNVAKWVRKDHVQTTEHWMNQPVTPNRIKE